MDRGPRWGRPAEDCHAPDRRRVPFLSPNGDNIVFVDNSGRSAFLTSLRSPTSPRALAGTQVGNRYLSPTAWSPDGKRIAGTLNAASGSAGVGIYDVATSVTTPPL